MPMELTPSSCHAGDGEGDGDGDGEGDDEGDDGGDGDGGVDAARLRFRDGDEA